MSKLSKILYILLILAIIFSGIYLVYKYQKNKNDQKFLSQLQGQVVFTRRNSQGVSDIWKIHANGSQEKMLFHNDFGIPYAGASFPQWSEDKKNIYFRAVDSKNELHIYQIDLEGNNLKVADDPSDYKLDGTSRASRANDIIVRQGDVYYQTETGQEIKVRNFIGPYNQDYNPGALEASWSPDKQYIIFESGTYIYIADKNGQVVRLTEGNEPDWKY